MPINKNFKRAIFKIKETYDLNQKEIASRLGIKATYLSEMINGSVPVTQKVINGLSEQFHIIPEGSTDETLLEDAKTPYETGVCLNCLKKDCEIHELHELIKEKDHRITELNEIITQQIKQWGASTSSWRVPDEGRDTG